MILKTLSMGRQPVYYVQKSCRNEDGKPSTKYVERLGALEDMEKRFGEEDSVGERSFITVQPASALTPR